MNRKDRLRLSMSRLEISGIISNFYIQGGMPGLRWIFTPCGFSERALTTSGVEDFILGVETALNAQSKRATTKWRASA